ncbi:MAG TPA: hypothetical protein PK452_16385, partial [Amaricoccus sp.]|uniref:hypothetical protein n=1 Tax=Amaricoccus sp. TaxID=1872485 RepID=UPI002CC4A774
RPRFTLSSYSKNALLALVASTMPILAPTPALAHASERMIVLTLPTGRYILGAATVVALTALLGALAPRLPAFRSWRLASFPHPPHHPGSWLAFAAFAALVATGFLGPHDPLANLLPLTVWTLLWVGLALASMLVGDLWRPIDPWTAPVTATRRLLGRTGSLGLSRLGHWPAVLGLLAIAWFEIVSLAPDDPPTLARAALLYWLAIFALATLEGPAWIRRGEALTLFFHTVSKIAPLWWTPAGNRTELHAGPPGAQILATPPLSPSAAAFVTLILATVTFDGLHLSFWWLTRLGINPLEFPGRSAVTLANSLGLLAAWAATAAAILATVALARRLARDTGPFRREAGPAMLSLLPIAAGYHAAHYLTQLLAGLRYALAALAGAPAHSVTLGFLTDAAAVRLIWNAQFAIILAAHLLAVLVNLRLAAPRPAIAHLPMTVLMVLYTILGLWLLATPTAG